MNFEIRQRGGLAQLARALALHARGHRFDSDILHEAINEFRNSSKAEEFIDIIRNKIIIYL